MKTSRTSICLILALLFTVVNSDSQIKPGLPHRGLAKTTAGLPYVLMNANNVTSWVHGDGFFNWLVSQSWNGEYPKGSGVGTIFSEGIVFGGKVLDGLYPDSIRVTGDTYQIGMQSGAIISDGSGNTVGADDPKSASSRAFAVRPDMPSSIADEPGKWPDLTPDAATFFQKGQSYVTDGDRATIAELYFIDWREWPAAKGAPWYVDSVKIVRNDNAYDPKNSHHIPGIPHAAKTIWFVCNDQDTSITKSFALSKPLGIEEQMTLWAYKSSTPLGNMIFKQVKLIYKGNPGASPQSHIDSLYIAQWSDPDLGDGGDDYAGCDSTLSLGYVWNSRAVDAIFASIGLPAAATGYAIVQGAAHYTGNASDSAIINFQWRHAYAYFNNRPMSSFLYFGQSYVDDPDIANAQTWFNSMRSCLPRPWYPAGIPYWRSSTDPKAFPTTFILPGDPTNGEGWIDGVDVPAGDRRIMAVHGPITLNLHDTAEVDIALVDALGDDNLSSVRQLKSSAAYAKKFFDEIPFRKAAPVVSCNTLYTSTCRISFQADARGINASGVAVTLKTYGGTTIASQTLVDDGLHEDGSSNDKIFGGFIDIPQQPVGLYAEATVHYADGNVVTWPNVIDNITTAGSLAIASPIVASDNLNSDGIPNPGENIRFTLTLTNNSSLIFQNLTVSILPVGKSLPFHVLNSHSSVTMHYEPAEPRSYFEFTIPKDFSGSKYTVPFSIRDSVNNVWRDTVRFDVAPLPGEPYQSPIARLHGTAAGNFQILVVDSLAAKDHTYHIVGVDSISANGDPGISIIDSTTNTSILVNHPLPDALGHNMPVTDGFKVLQGNTIDTSRAGMESWSIPTGTRHFSPIGGATGLGLEGFGTANYPPSYNHASGTIGWAHHFVFGGVGTTLILPSRAHSVVLRLASLNYSTLWDPQAVPSDTNFSKGYRWLMHASSPPADSSFAPWIVNTSGSIAYQDFNYSVPFSAWDIDRNPPVRLTVGFFENNVVNGKVDGRYWPPTGTTIQGFNDNSVAQEFCLIFDKLYSILDDATFHADMSGNSSLPLMWVMTCAIRNTANWTSGDEFEIDAARLPSPTDLWSFNPAFISGFGKRPILPRRYSLFQNYPNPFNPWTTIRYQLPMPSRVVVRIYNLLGQEIATLMDGPQAAGEQSLVWDSKNKAGQSVSSGVYFYRIDIVSLSGNAGHFRDVKKMILLK